MDLFWKILPLALILLLTAVGVPLVKRQMDTLYTGFRRKATLTEMQHMADAIQTFYLDRDRLPKCNEQSRTCPELVQLLHRYLQSKKKNLTADIWGTPYGYAPLLENGGETGFLLKSAGPDKKWETRDDIELKKKF